MARTKVIFMLVIALVAVAASAPAEAHGGRSRVSVGFVFGGPWYYPAYYPYYPPYHYYHYPQVVPYPAEQTVYIERGSDAAAPAEQSQGYWYYCRESKTYHPYVKHCPGGWEKQTPAPPPGR